MALVKLTGFRDAASTIPVEAWVNPERIAYFRAVSLGKAQTRIFFAEDGTLEVAETPDEILVALRWCSLELTERCNGQHVVDQLPADNSERR
jgi:hypothetical protein